MFRVATGARDGEPRGLRWHDFDGTPLVHLEANITKYITPPIAKDGQPPKRQNVGH